MDLENFLLGMPVVTRYWFLASTIVPLLGRFGFIQMQYMFLQWELVINKFQFWRPLTALIYYPVTPQTGFHWLMMCYFLYNYSKTLERETFRGRSADYLFMLIFNWFFCVGLCMALEIYFLLEPMVISVLYVWCQVNKDTIVSFWFGMRFPARYLPWVLWGFNAILRGGGTNELVGIFVGHAYFFVALKYPDEYGVDLISTPEFLHRLIPDEDGGIHGQDGDIRGPRQQPRGGHHWPGGAGARLGGN
uniref:Derlin n=1 Tax=Caenorhabditis tropicalis TaxID=1561998 RepID=A0A1I7T265_9PELO